MTADRSFYEFGPFRLDATGRLLFRGGEPVPLPPKAVDTLLFLVENAGNVLEKDRLLKQVWHDAFVEEGSLTRAISVVRKALGDGEDGQEFIATISRRGYRFAAPVKLVKNGAADSLGSSSQRLVPWAQREGLGDHAATPIDAQTPPAADSSANRGFEQVETRPKPIESKQSKRRWKWKLLFAALALLLIGAALIYPRLAEFIERQTRITQLQNLTAVPLTSLPGNVASPTFSPDGSQIAFAWDGENNGAGYDLYVKVIGREPSHR